MLTPREIDALQPSKKIIKRGLGEGLILVVERLDRGGGKSFVGTKRFPRGRKGKEKNSVEINKYMNELTLKKELAQPTKIKTGGSTFKNPLDKTSLKVWEIIKKSVPLNTSFGDAAISEKHCNFLINKQKASSKDMKNLINFVKENVYKKTGIKLELEIIFK